MNQPYSTSRGFDVRLQLTMRTGRPVIVEPYRMMKINEWHVHADTCTLLSGQPDDGEAGEPVKISPRSMDVLIYLAERPGQVVSSEELLKAFWVSSSATDHAVHKVIASLRSALGDEPHNPRFIKTLPKRGYSLIATVSTEDPAIARPAPDRPRRTIRSLIPRYRVPGAAFALACITAAAAAVWMYATVERGVTADTTEAPADDGRRIALFRPSLSQAAPATQYNQVNALLDSLSVNLGKIPELDVIVAGNEDNNSETIDNMQVGYALNTAIYDTGENLRLTVNLLRMPEGTSLYANQFALTDTGLLALEGEIIPEIVESVSIHLDEERLQNMRSWGTNDAQAYQHFLKAGFYTDQSNHRDWSLALEHYEAAIEKDPYFINAYLGKATAANNMAVYSRNDRVDQLSREVLDLSRRLALVAPESEALETLNLVRMRIEGRNEWQQEREYREQIRSGTAPGYIYARYALYLIGARMYKEAEAFLALAQTTERHRITPNEAWNFRTQTLPPEELAEVKVNQLLERPVHIGILGTAISSLAFTGNLEKARFFLARQAEHDGDGVRAHLSAILIGAMSGKLNHDSECRFLFEPERINDPDLAFNNGVLFFMLEDFERGAEYWRNLTRIDQRKLYTRLHAIEPFFPDSIRLDPRYADLLDELKVGRNWQQRLMTGVEELSEYTGISLDPMSRRHHENDTLMLRNNLWDGQTRNSVEQRRQSYLPSDK